jgi:AcrR family transcriptional regulator
VRRRRPDEVHRLILDSATALFSEHGLAGTSMRDIANKAGVAEPLLYRHFGSKDSLFREAVLSPVRDFFVEYTAAWRASLAEGRPAPGSTAYMSGLYDVLRANRGLFLTWLASHVRQGARADEPSPLVELLSDIEELVTIEQGRSLRASLDPGLAVRFTFSLCLSMALFGDLMFSADDPRPDHDRLVSEMGAYLTYATVRDGGR